MELPENVIERYRGEPYGWWGGRDQVRVMLYIRADHISNVR